MDYKALSRANRDAFVSLLYQELERPVFKRLGSDEPLCDGAVIAEMLRAADVPLKDLGIEAKTPSRWSAGSEVQSNHWSQLQSCLSHFLKKDDALTIFEALMTSVAGRSRQYCQDAVLTALRSPSWRLEAIERCPDVFRLGAPREESKHPPRQRQASEPWNALDVLAEDSSAGYAGQPEQLAATIKALKDLGVPHLVRNTGYTLLHQACLSHKAETLKVFIEAFPLNINDRNQAGETALNVVARRSDTDAEAAAKAKLLLEAGADPMIPNSQGDTPLEVVMTQSRWQTLEESFQVATVLIDGGSHANADIALVVALSVYDEFKERVLGYAHAARAQKILDDANQPRSELNAAPRPL